MKKHLTPFVFFMLMAPLSYAQPQIIDFLLDEIELCDLEDNCIDVAKEQLATPMNVKGYDPLNNTVEVVYQSTSYWIHTSEVTLNEQAKASRTCALEGESVDSNEVSQPKDKTTNSMMGVGEPC